jgi:GH15 family glucan-1,4-alpha-glucosidase
MPRDLPVGNGSLLVNFDQRYQLRDIYWPYVGQENHTAGHPCRFGLWVDGTFSWIGDPGWSRSLNYERDTLVTHVTLYSPGLNLRLVCRDAVDFHEDLYLRQIRVENLEEEEREIRLFLTHDFHISGNAVGDSAYYEPERRALFHYKGARWFMANSARERGDGWAVGIDGWAVGIKEVQGREGAWRDAEDGALSGNAVAQGSVDSVLAINLRVPGRSSARAWYWIAAAEDFRQVVRINRAVRRRGPEAFLDRTRHYWRLWLSKAPTAVYDLSPEVRGLFRRSLLILRTQIDNHGAVLAANDFDATHFARDTYSYMWPRDGALVAAALIDGGYSVLTRSFFEFCHRAITDEGYLLHKYNPDGTLASSWHGWYDQGAKHLPVQEDETALVIWALWRHFRRFRDVEFVKPHYRGLITRAANWMLDYRDDATGLPLPSWDLWEERRGVSAWTCGAVWAGLRAAAQFADAFGEQDLAARYRAGALGVRAAVQDLMWDPAEHRFARSLHWEEGVGWTRDTTVDAALVGLWYFGMLDTAGARVVATMQAFRARLWVQTAVGGIARYENDYYYQADADVERVPGNPWFICTLWWAQWLIATAASADDMKAPAEILEWVVSRALPSGVLAEQVHPTTGQPLSVSPLTWSHATFVKTVQEYAARMDVIGGSGQ